MPWIYKGEVFSDVDKYVGFVYIITNLRTDKKYIGKKLFHFAKTKQVKGKKKRYKVDSDWQDYFGSNDELNEHVKVLGPDAFRREIIRLCTSKGEMSYFEAKYQFQYDVLESDQWYNTSTDILYEYQNVGTGTFWIDITSPTISSGNVTVPGGDTFSPFLLMGA